MAPVTAYVPPLLVPPPPAMAREVMIAADVAFVALRHRRVAKYDILHVSSALVLGCDTFWSFHTKAKKLAKL